MLLMTFQVIAVRPDNTCTSYKVRALLNVGLSASFISERVAQHLRLPHRWQESKVSGIGGGTMSISSQASVNFTMKPVHYGVKTRKIEALVLRKITPKIPSYSVVFNNDWKYLSNQTLTNPDFEVPGSKDILLRADVFSRTVLHGQRFGPSGSLWLWRQCLVGYWPALFEPQELRVTRTIVASQPHFLMTSLRDLEKLRITICSSLSCPQSNRLL